MLHSHSLNSPNRLFLLFVKGPTAVGKKEIEYLTVLDLGALILPLRSISRLWNSGLSGCVLSCKMSISLLAVRLWYSVSVESCVFPVTPPAFLINLSILLLSALTHFPPNNSNDIGANTWDHIKLVLKTDHNIYKWQEHYIHQLRATR